jgi:hypothetical protein
MVATRELYIVTGEQAMLFNEQEIQETSNQSAEGLRRRSVRSTVHGNALTASC